MNADPYRVLVQLPSKIDEAKLLAYCAALQGFIIMTRKKTEAWNTVYVGQERMIVPVELDITCTDAWHRKIFEKVLQPHDMFYVSPPKERYHFVLDLRLSQEQAAIMSQERKLNKHFSQFLGIFLGAEWPALPNIEHIPREYNPEYACDILVTPKIMLWFDQNYVTKYLSGKVRVVGKNTTFEQLCAELNSAKLLISEVSLESYLTSAFKNHVMEIYDEKVGGRSYMSKFTNPNYRQFLVDDKTVPEAQFFMRLHAQWQTIVESSTTSPSRSVTLA